MGVKFIPFKDMLFNDRALATHIDYTDKDTQMNCYTKCTALGNGWVYNIPMWNNMGTGYVYSSKYISDDEAEIEFREYLDDQECPLMPIKIKHGKHEKAWVKNVIGIGLSYGFLEPLESTGLLTTHENLLKFSDLLATRDRHVTNHDRSIYNFSVEKLLESLKNFVTLHYTLSLREDTKYWKDATNNVELLGKPGDYTESTLHALQDYRLFIDYLDKKAFDPNLIGDGIIYIASGMGIRPFTETIFNDLADDERRLDVAEYHDGYCKSNKSMLEWVDTLPSHYQYLKDTIYVESV